MGRPRITVGVQEGGLLWEDSAECLRLLGSLSTALLLPSKKALCLRPQACD